MICRTSSACRGFKAGLFVIVCALMLTGCVVGRTNYKQPQIPNARYFGDTCYGGGPPSLAYYAYHGIFISFTLDGDAIELGLHVPPEKSASLEGNRVTVIGLTANGEAIEVTGVLRALPHGSFGATAPRSAPFLWRPDPYTSGAAIANLRGGGTRAGGFFWYVFGAFPDRSAIRFLFLPSNLVKGAVELPPIAVDGVRYSPQKVPFTMKRVTKLLPVNC